MTLRMGGRTVAGVVAGRAFDSTGTAVDVRGVDDQPAALTGGPTSGGSLMGVLNGRVTIDNSSCSGEQSTWRLEPAA